MLVVEKIKDVLVGSLGVVGMVVWSLVCAVLAFLPLSFLNFPLWMDLVIIFVILSMDFVGGLISLILWIWSFIIVISAPIDGLSIFYFVVFAVYFVTSVLPIVTNIVISLIALIVEIFNKD